MKKAAARACQQVMKSIKREPTTIIITEEPGDSGESSIDEIRKWLFHRRQEDGHTNR